MKVEVAYALPQKQKLITVDVAEGATAREAIELSGILPLFPEIDLASSKIGVFSRVVTLDHPLREGDRVEIYRPLLIDPKEVRRRKAEEKRALTGKPQ
ncbi:RnfH family protein [Pleionea sp. CnH1-48]|uniref:RnfH family protein n=1 Tax=Pleionea sp. CnH1-48 TaxID=2954494 RepID=UPI002097F2A2|nr:RnfH family protein [Pleionea sp. CnH1-48]MCO7227402.1 RnfH family protein [Pleionea sp. CnH1-48]